MAQKENPREAALLKQLEEVTARNAELQKALTSGQKSLPIQGTYKGYGFADGHTRIRDKAGNLLDTAKVIGAANAGDQAACAILDWYIKKEYAYLVKREDAPADETEATGQ